MYIGKGKLVMRHSQSKVCCMYCYWWLKF